MLKDRLSRHLMLKYRLPRHLMLKYRLPRHLIVSTDKYALAICILQIKAPNVSLYAAKAPNSLDCIAWIPVLGHPNITKYQGGINSRTHE